jgi:hypothetical protein
MKYLLDEPGLQQLANLLPDCPVLLLVEAAQSLLHWFGVGLDLQGVLGDIPQDARHVRGTSREYVMVHAKKVNKHGFLFGVKGGADAHHLIVRATGVERHLLHLHRRLEGACTPLGVGLLR